MQKCPKCGYRERFDWASILRTLIFLGLCLVLIFTTSREYRLIGDGAIVLFMSVQLWESSKTRTLNSKLVKLFGDDRSPNGPANS
jgi:hypothetical protein